MKNLRCHQSALYQTWEALIDCYTIFLTPSLEPVSMILWTKNYCLVRCMYMYFSFDGAFSMISNLFSGWPWTIMLLLCNNYVTVHVGKTVRGLWNVSSRVHENWLWITSALTIDVIEKSRNINNFLYAVLCSYGFWIERNNRMYTNRFNMF